ncbi:MAG: esterase [Bryobacterales bacterium]|nr:esterase [Bryobacterales bacterium]
MGIRLLLFGLLVAPLAWPQAPAPSAPVSPEVHPDGRVTFRIRAPKAGEVTLAMDYMPAGTREKMTRDSEGVWSVTIGPLAPTVYIYSFTVDGVTMPDPVNPNIKLRSSTSASMVEVPAVPPALWEARGVPHGSVEINWQKSTVINGETRWIWVYTPPGYERDLKRRYPVLYLFHGSNDIAGGWTLAGHANFILDNLLAEKKAVPMIVVMPYGHAVPYGARGGQVNNTDLYGQYVVKDVIPLVESKYRVARGRENRAIAGLSMGGGQSITIGFRHLDLFSAIGAFSAAVQTDFEKMFPQVLADAKGTNSKLKVLWLACGKQDGLFERSQKFSELLAAHQIQHTWRPTEGAHVWRVWREYLTEFAPLLFR